MLLDRINAGGMAEVFRAKMTGAEQFERYLAIKCMLPQLLADEHFIGMFIDEAKLASQLSHANIVQIYELGRQHERLYIAMELVQGRDLRHVIRLARARGLALPQGFAAYVISRAAAGLDFAHRKQGVDGRPLQLVHRDVSPQNILVSYDGEVKVVDFGIAKAEARATETQAGVLKGKFAYMSPEQVRGDDIDRRADIFALGSV
ncbi:MAG: serine/threonine protein kinase, partial [Deltaproteobacteria bacterium]